FSGSNTHFHAYSKSSAVTGSPFDHFASSRILNVYVNPSSETSIDSAIASSGSPSLLILVNPSNTWSRTALEVVAVERPGCNEGGSATLLMFNICSAATPASPESSVVVSPLSALLSASSEPPPQATKKMLRVNTNDKSNNHLLNFIPN